MSLVLTLVVLTVIFSIYSLVKNLRSAPNGYEDEAGFHFSPGQTGSDSNSVKSVATPSLAKLTV